MIHYAFTAESDMKQFRKSINIWRSYGKLSTGSFFHETRCNDLSRYSIKCFFQPYKRKVQLLSFTPTFLLHLPYSEACISRSFPWHKSKLHVIDLYFLSDASFKHMFYHFHFSLHVPVTLLLCKIHFPLDLLSL